MNIYLNFFYVFPLLLVFFKNVNMKTITIPLVTSDQSLNMFPYIKINFTNSIQEKLFLITTSFVQSLLFDNIKKSTLVLMNEEPASAVYYKSSIIGYYSKIPIEIGCEIANKNDTLDIVDFEFLKITIDNNSSLLINQPDNYGGVLSFPRRSNFYHYSILKVLYHKQYINENIFGIFNNESLIIGTYEEIKKERNIDSNMIRNCFLYVLDNTLYSQWVCGSNYLIITNNTNNIENKTNSDFINIDLKVVFEPMVYPIIIPISLKDKILSMLIKTSSSYCSYYKQEKTDFMYKTNHINSKDLELYSIQCPKTETVNSIDILENFLNLNTFSIVLNGYVYTLYKNELFTEDQNNFYLNIMFANKQNFPYVILGNAFMRTLNGIIFDDENAEIYFVLKSDRIPINIQSVIKDKREKRGVLFFLFTIIGVAFVILLALLIPYFFYWRSRRKMLDRLNYEIIYRRVDDVKQGLLQSQNSLK